jgi:hypothetical protein
MSDFKELELEINDIGDEVAEENLRAVLRQINGVHTARITATGVHVIYNPLGVTWQEITNTVRQAGFKVDYQQPG